MDALQIKLCDVQGRLFELSADNKMPSEDFVRKFMTSETAKRLDSKFNHMQWAGEEYIMEDIMSEKKDGFKKGEVFSKDILYWIGYVYRYWHYYNGESSSKIYKEAPFKTMKQNYLMFHTMDPGLAVEKLKEIAET